MANLLIIAMLTATVVALPPRPPLPPVGKDCDCPSRLCPPIPECGDGFIRKDACGCCDLCVRTKEMSKCGGFKGMDGLCDKGMVCKVRHPKSVENVGEPMTSKVGRCEKEACKDVTCGKHQWCTIKDGRPTCGCHLRCNEQSEELVCGERDGKNYPNHCAVRRLECETQTEIGYFPGPCVPCELNKRRYKFGDVVPSGEQCETCTCKHGRWECSFDLDCLKREVYKDYNCTGFTRLHDEIICLEGFKCKFTKLSDGKSGLPDLGVCERLDPAKTCGLPSESGSCYGYFQRWYFDVKTRTCKEFAYGGCEGNDNRFSSVNVCEDICGGYKGPEIKPIVVPGKPDVPKVPGKPDLPDVPKKPVVPEVPTVPDLPDVPKKPVVPKVPTIPDIPDVPKKPVVPKVPAIPDLPDVPKETNVPKVPEMPDISGKPKIPEEPKVSELGQIKDLEVSKKVKITNVGKFSLELGGNPIEIRRAAPPKEVEKVGFCKIGNDVYKEGERFILKHCIGRCECRENGVIACVIAISLCPPVGIKCGPNEKKIEVEEPVAPTTKCTCKIPKCVPDMDKKVAFCKIGNDVYKGGERFISKDCTGMCECRENGDTACVSLCPPVGIKCGPNEKKIEVEEPVGPTTKCTCTRPKCVPDMDKKEISKDVKKPMFASEEITIHGKVTFEKSPGKLPTPSCLRVVFEDVSVQDDESVVYKTEEFNVSNTDINAHYDYEFKTKKPKTSHEFYAVSAVLNVGWCASPDSNDWVRNFDFLSDSTIYIPLREDSTDYEIDIPVIYYCRGNQCPTTKKDKPDEMKVKSEIKKPEDTPPPLPFGPEDGPEMPPDVDPEPFGGYFGEDYVRSPEYGTGNITIRGKLTFDRSPGKLPEKSCLHVDFKDSSLADVSSVLYKGVELDVSGVEIGNVYEYSLVSRRPLQDFGFTVSATLNVGWCPGKDTKSWLRDKDFLTDTSFGIFLKPDVDEYTADMNLVFYCYGEECPPVKQKKAVESKPDKGPERPPVPLSSDIGQKPDDTEAANGKEPRVIPMSEMKRDTMKRMDQMDETSKNASFSHNREPVYGNKNMTIQGVMVFDKIPGKLPKSSCLKLLFEDISFQDVKSVLYATDTWDMSGIKLKKDFKYSFVTRKPKNLKSVYSISIVLNIGWCPSKGSSFWIRNNDYLSESSIKVPLKKDEDIYIRDIPVVFYCRGSTCGEKSTNITIMPATTKGPSVTGGPAIVAPIRQLDSASVGKEDAQTVATKEPTKEAAKEEIPILPPTLPPVDPVKPRRHSKCIDYETKLEYEVGEEWYGSDDCMHCTCSRGGYPVCSSPMCELPFCRTGPARHQKGRCCPVCPEHHICKKQNGRAVVEHERWQENNCSVCQCTKNGIVCVDPSTMKHNCKWRQRWNGKCKPICIDDIIPLAKSETAKGCNKPDGSLVSFDTQWNLDNCTSCKCSPTYGVMCDSPQCDFTDRNCQKLENVPGECCPRCQLRKCRHHYRYYSEGEKVIKDDRRTACECKGGEWSCEAPTIGEEDMP